MGKISNEVSKGLGAAIAEVQEKLGIASTSEDTSVSPEDLLNSGVKAKRKRRTKAEIEAARQELDSEGNSLFDSLAMSGKQEEARPKNHDEFCALEIKKAHEKGLPDPDFDFRNYYEKGQIAYYVRVQERLGEKEIIKVFLRTIYPRTLIGSEEKSCCHCIGYHERDRIFETPRDAQTYYDSLAIAPKYAEEPKSRTKTQKSINETSDIENTGYEAYTTSEEGSNED